jgi:hypothetical protein
MVYGAFLDSLDNCFDTTPMKISTGYDSSTKYEPVWHLKSSSLVECYAMPMVNIYRRFEE